MCEIKTMKVRYVYVTYNPLNISRPLCVNRRAPTDLDFGVKHKIPLYLLSFKTSYWVTAKRNKKDFTSPKLCRQATLANIFTWSAKPDRWEYFVTSMSKCANAIKTLPEWETTRQYNLMQQCDGKDEYEILGHDQLDTQSLYYTVLLLWSSTCFEHIMLKTCRGS